VDVGARSLVVEITGEEDKIDALYDLMRPFGILELMRTGRVAMVRGKAAGRISDDVGAGAMDLSRNGVVAELAGSVPGHYEGV
jgi:acetolactate synthase-1/3 small subunit